MVRVREVLRVDRHHFPEISLWESATRLLDRPLYLVTDGHKLVQARKLEALRIGPRFRHTYITHRYGITHAKPVARCFALIMRRERCGGDE